MVLPYLITGIHVLAKESIVLRGALKRLDAENIPHTFVAHLNNGSWKNYMIWSGVTAQQIFTLPKLQVFSLCIHGDIHVWVAENEHLEQVDPIGGVKPRRWMLDLRCIAGILHAVGMQRSAFRRSTDGVWTDIGSGAELQAGEEIDLGFRSIDGVSLDELYAVGFGGEIWHFSRSVWRRIASPTNLRLDKVVTLPCGDSIVGGAGGVLLRGRGHSWHLIEQSLTSESFTDIAYYQKKILLADGKTLYELRGSDLAPVLIETEPTVNARYMHTSNNLLGVVGRSSGAIYDGATWQPIRLPSAG